MAVDSAEERLEGEIAAARRAIVEVISEADGGPLTAYEIKMRARNGWSAGAMGIALRQLIHEKVLQRDDDLLVRRRIA